jgi:Tfp pilus assembly protein PilW
MRRTQAGVSLMELLVSVLMTLVIAGALFSVFTNTFEMRDVVVGQGTTETSARTPLDLLADHLRNAQQYWTTGSTTPTLVSQSSVIAAGSATSVTYYRSNSSSDTVQYWLDGTNLKRTDAGGTTIVMSNVQSLAFTYYVNTSGSYNVDYNDNTKYSPITGSSPTNAERPLLGQIKISARVTIDGYSRELASLVRLRNSPFKVHL